MFRETGLRRKVPYIQTQNGTRKGASKNNGKEFREKSVKERRAIHSDTELMVERNKQG
jgi:hypothetical protein